MSSSSLSLQAINTTLDWAYEKAVNGLGLMDSAQDLAASYAASNLPLEDQVNTLIRWQSTKAATSGFINGMAGVFAMPITIPANIGSVMYVQIRMIAAIAHMGGHDLKDDRVKTLVYACLCGNAAKDVIKELGIQVGTRLTEQTIQKVSGQAIGRINEAIGFRLLSRFGGAGTVNMSKIIPLVGGIIGGSMDSIATRTIGHIARDTFITSKSSL